jgi:uncharacterized protein
MAICFFDTSALVKRYVREPGHLWVRGICDPAQAHELFIAQITQAEMVAAFCRKAREKNISAARRDRLIGEFRRDTGSAYIIRPVTDVTYIRAGDLCRLHRLRAYDAVQLAAALALRDDAQSARAPLPIFVSADSDLLTFAAAEGLSVENPNKYP